MQGNARTPRRAMLGGAAGLAAMAVAGATPAYASTIGGNRSHSPPNVVLILLDDVGYGDWSSYGSREIRTPQIDSVGESGMSFSRMYTGAPVCMPARAALLTGRYSQRVGLPWVLYPDATEGLSAYEHTLAEMMRRSGYRTGIFGKWHLGDPGARPELNPENHGFDTFFGTPAFNTEEPFPLYDGKELVEMVDQQEQVRLTGRCTDRALEFIRDHRHDPFFLFLPYHAAHAPYYPEKRFEGSSEAGPYGDLVQQVDFHIGRVLAELESAGLAEDTVVIVTSDNGPTDEGTGGLRGAKGTTFEGGIRVPFVVRWPGRIEPGTTYDHPACFTDILPTLASTVGAAVPRDRPIDGLDLTPAWQGRRLAPRVLYHYHDWTLNAVQFENWKLHLPGRENGLQSGSNRTYGPDSSNGTTKAESLLYDLDLDSRERRNLASRRPDMVQALSRMAKRFDAEIQDQKGQALKRARGERRRPITR